MSQKVNKLFHSLWLHLWLGLKVNTPLLSKMEKKEKRSKMPKWHIYLALFILIQCSTKYSCFLYYYHSWTTSWFLYELHENREHETLVKHFSISVKVVFLFIVCLANLTTCLVALQPACTNTYYRYRRTSQEKFDSVFTWKVLWDFTKLFLNFFFHFWLFCGSIYFRESQI